MRKNATLFIASILLVGTLSGLVVGLTSSTADPTQPTDNYSFTYDGYTVTQVSATPGEYMLVVNYSITGNDVNGTYTIPYAINGDDYSFKTTDVSNINSEVIIVPPKIMNGSNEKFVSSLLESASSTTNSVNMVKKLYILTDNKNLSFPGNFIRNVYSSLTDLVIVANATVNSNLLNQVNTIQRVYISNYVTSEAMSGSLYNVGSTKDNSNSVVFEMKIGGNESQVKQLITKQITGGLTLKLLPGSTAVNSLDLTNVQTLSYDRSYWTDSPQLSAFASSTTGGTPSLVPYGDAPSNYSVNIEQNQMGVAVDKETAAEDEVVTVTLTPPQGKQVASVSVIDANSTPVQATVDQQNPNVYTFTMPASDVTVSATFENEPSVSITPAVSNVAKGSSTNVTVSADNLKNVSSLYITLTYDATMFELKSPAYSNLLDSAILKGDVTKGEYVVAFSEPQNITGDLFTFQLEAKDDATVGVYAISCVVEINGTVNNGVNQFEASYNKSSELTIGNMLGDLDSDGDVDEDDAIYLLLYTFRASTHPLPEGQIVDYNNDGVVNSDDAIYLKNYLTDHAQYPLSGGA